MDLPRYPVVDSSIIRAKLREGLGGMGFAWALANLSDVHATYRADSGMGCNLSVVAITESLTRPIILSVSMSIAMQQNFCC